MSDNLTYVGKTNWRNTNQVFGIRDRDRLNHIYCVGKSGTGKSTLLLNMALSDIGRGNGLCLIDPHGDVAETILHYVPKNRIGDVIYFNATDVEYPVAFNPLNRVDAKVHSLVTANLISAFKKQWADFWGPRLEHILRFSILALLHYPPATLLDVQKLLTDAMFRSRVLNIVPDASVIAFWKGEYDKYPPAFRNEAIASVLNKLGAFAASSILRNIVGQESSSFSMQEALDNGKILICNLSKGQIGEDASALLGAMILTSIQSAALYRASYPEEKRKPFYLYVDEVHSFMSLSFSDILAEARKYGLSLFLTHQYLDQLHEDIRAAIFGNVGTMIAFRLGAEDASAMIKEFYPPFNEYDLVHLPKFSMYLKLQIDGATSKPFSADSLPLPPITQSHKQEIVYASQKKYGTETSKIASKHLKKFDQNEGDQGILFAL